MESTQEGNGSVPRLRRSTRLSRPLDTAGASTGLALPRKHDNRTSINLGPGRGALCEKDVALNALSTVGAASAGVSEPHYEQSGSWSRLPDEVRLLQQFSVEVF